MFLVVHCTNVIVLAATYLSEVGSSGDISTHQSPRRTSRNTVPQPQPREQTLKTCPPQFHPSILHNPGEPHPASLRRCRANTHNRYPSPDYSNSDSGSQSELHKGRLNPRTACQRSICRQGTRILCLGLRAIQQPLPSPALPCPMMQPNETVVTVVPPCLAGHLPGKGRNIGSRLVNVDTMRETRRWPHLTCRTRTSAVAPWHRFDSQAPGILCRTLKERAQMPCNLAAWPAGASHRGRCRFRVVAGRACVPISERDSSCYSSPRDSAILQSSIATLELELSDTKKYVVRVFWHTRQGYGYISPPPDYARNTHVLRRGDRNTAMTSGAACRRYLPARA